MILYFVLAGLLGAVGIGVGIFYFVGAAIGKSKATNGAWRKDEYDSKSKFWIFVLVLLDLILMAATILGVMNPDYSYLVLCFFVAFGLSIFFAYVFSPMRLRFLPIDIENAGSIGCLMLLVYGPIGIGIGAVSVAAILLCSWFFALLAVYRGTKKWVKILSLTLVGVVLLSIPLSFVAGNIVLSGKQDKAYFKIQEALDNGSTGVVEFTEEEKSYISFDLRNYFELYKGKKIVAEKLAETYCNQDIDGMFKVFDLVYANQADMFINEKRDNFNEGNVGFTDDFLAFVKSELAQKAEGSDGNYEYKGYKISVFDFNGAIIIRKDVYDKEYIELVPVSVVSSDYSADYLKVGETVELHEKMGGFHR